MKIRIIQEGQPAADGKIQSISLDGKTITLEAPLSLADGTYNGVAVSQLVDTGLLKDAQIKYDNEAKPFLLFAGDVNVVGTTVTRVGIGSFIDDGFAQGETISFGDGSGAKFVVNGVTDTTLTLASAPGDGTYNRINKMLGTLTLINGSSWLDS